MQNKNLASMTTERGTVTLTLASGMYVVLLVWSEKARGSKEDYGHEIDTLARARQTFRTYANALMVDY